MSRGMLEQHRIHHIHTLRVQSRYPRVVGRNARHGVHGAGSTVQVCVITTDQGAVGWGISRMVDREMPGLVGRCVATLLDPEVGVVAPEAMGLDFALHDLAGVILDWPVYQMLGSGGTATLPCYDGAIYMDDLLPVDDSRGVSIVLANCRHDYALGYRAFKLKIGRGHQWMEPEAGLRRDIEVTRQVRECFPECAILVDANDGYSCERFLRYLDAVADCELFWVEEPFPENRPDLTRLREFLEKRSPRTLVADGESRYDIELLLSLSREGLLDVLMMDIAGLGFTPWRQWMPRVIEAGAYASPHTWGDPLKTRYAAQLGAGLGNVPTVEGIPAMSDDVTLESYRLEAGQLHVPNAAGFGMKLRPELVSGLKDGV